MITMTPMMAASSVSPMRNEMAVAAISRYIKKLLNWLKNSKSLEAFFVARRAFGPYCSRRPAASPGVRPFSPVFSLV
nr:hypothetical protein [Methanocella paludicola]